jgi:hypothetical protein
MTGSPPIVERVHQRLFSLPSDQQLTFLMIIAREMFTTSLGLERRPHEDNVDAVRRALQRRRLFDDFQTRLNRAMLRWHLRGEVEEPRLIEGFYTVASWFGYTTELVQTLERAIQCPLTSRQQCPCCGYFTLSKRGLHDLCPVCRWQDDEASEFFGLPAPERPQGPNHIQLWQARENFRAFGASEDPRSPRVRAPRPEEFPAEPLAPDSL